MSTNFGDARQKSEKALVGMAHHALRAYVKAYEMKAGEGFEYSYLVPEDGKTASILDHEGATVEKRPIEQWAKEGPALRLALIGLKAMKEDLESAADKAGQRTQVRFYLNVFESKAVLTVDGNPLQRDELAQRAAKLNLPDGLNALLPTLGAGDLEKIACWARIGREVEVDFFHILETAERHELPEAEQVRERGYRLGVIRRRRNQSGGAAQ